MAKRATRYIFAHPERGIVTATITEFYCKYGMSPKEVSRLCRGTYKVLDGWTAKHAPKRTPSREEAILIRF